MSCGGLVVRVLGIWINGKSKIIRTLPNGISGLVSDLWSATHHRSVLHSLRVADGILEQNEASMRKVDFQGRHGPGHLVENRLYHVGWEWRTRAWGPELTLKAISLQWEIQG